MNTDESPWYLPNLRKCHPDGATATEGSREGKTRLASRDPSGRYRSPRDDTSSQQSSAPLYPCSSVVVVTPFKNVSKYPFPKNTSTARTVSRWLMPQTAHRTSWNSKSIC